MAATSNAVVPIVTPAPPVPQEAVANIEVAQEAPAAGSAADRNALAHKPSFFKGLLHMVTDSYINLLLVAVPVALATPAIKEHSEIAAFVICLIAIIPLAKLLGTATEELALYTSQAVGGLLNATFGNAVELIIGIVAVKDGLITVTQSSIMGSILSNLLLVLGMAFVAAGNKFKVSKFSSASAQTAAT